MKMAARLFRQAVRMRLAAPGSGKRGCCDALARHHGVAVCPDERYRMINDLDADRIVRLHSVASFEVRGLQDEQAEILFFDVTTLPFACEKHHALRRKGLSKDGNPQKVKVVLALFQSAGGLPIA